MLKPHEKVARSLKVLLERQGEGRRIFRSAEFHREDRERLLRSSHLLPVTRRWLMLSSPGSVGHDTTPWYASFWEFCARYSTHRFGERWHLSPALSLLRRAENTTVPRQVIVHSELGGSVCASTGSCGAPARAPRYARPEHAGRTRPHFR